MPLAFAPAASAQTGGNPLGGIEITLAQTITSLPNTLTHPLAGSSGDRPPGNDACADPALVSPLLTCVIDSARRSARRPVGDRVEGDRSRRRSAPCARRRA